MILLDFVLPDMKGDEVCRRLMADPTTAEIPVVYVSGFGSDLQPDRVEIPNVKGSISKPFTSETLIKAVRSYLPESASLASEVPFPAPENVTPPVAEPPASPIEPVSFVERPEVPPAAFSVVDPMPRTVDAGSQAAGPTDTNGSHPSEESAPVAPTAEAPTEATVPASEAPATPSSAYFCGDSSFFSLHWALQTIAREKLTGTLRAFWSKDSVDLLARDGHVVVITTRDLELYCEEAPVTLLNVDRERVEAARARQASDGCPIFVTLANEGLILREPGCNSCSIMGRKSSRSSGRIAFGSLLSSESCRAMPMNFPPQRKTLINGR